MENSNWSSLASLESLVVSNVSADLPGYPGIDNISKAEGPKPKKPRKADYMKDFSMPKEMASAYNMKTARLQSQAEALPYQPATVVIQPPKQLPPEAENDRRMYVPDLNQAITHRDVFNYFCNFGDLERVCVRNGTDNLNYAMVLFKRTAGMEQAIKSNSHVIKGHQLSCRKATERYKNKSVKQPFGLFDNKREISKKPEPKSPIKSTVRQQKIEDPKRSIQLELNRTSKPLRRSKRIQKQVESKAKNQVTPSKSDRNFVYAVTTKDGISRWSFKLSRLNLSLDEQRVMGKGLPQTAQTLLAARTSSSKSPKSSAPKSAGTHCDPPGPTRVPPGLPSPLKPPLVPLPKKVIPEPVKPDLRSVILSTLGQNYVHHCYTNVEAYRRSKCYIDILPDERIKRPSIKEYVDQIYGEKK
ncbi:uncharacterized protein LOC128257759 [Drosophila gunungcola]|uniref:RRM domain-containing protein n=1 Tax=Drosophila gunungcola TaxID=103775 RepID=A0A9P9YZH2_9MUSC|nr:uncharacterized protein LOC128257759 [Drosophila gunungcola]KAI8045718.1 hypothetical protein M5D96_001902 [Drosophila gunungcola]